jgi:hypothetical protein
MKNLFDDLAREIARGTSRRDVLRGLGSGLMGLFLSSVGIKKAKGQGPPPIVCGTCQGCEITTDTCGLPCNPPSAGTALCAQASSDGSYLRLAYYLTTNGFLSVGESDSVLVYQSGALLQSVLVTNFQNPSVPGNTAFVSYSVNPQGDITPVALVLQNGAPIYALSVDYNGRIIQTVATQTSGTQALNTLIAGTNRGAAKPEVLFTCDRIVDIICGVVGLGLVCYAVGAAVCAAEGAGTLLIGAVPCGIAVTLLCGLGDYAACEIYKASSHICDCSFNIQPCNGICCGPCMDCTNGICVNGANVASCQSHVCCNGQCCAPGLVCTNNVCTSPNGGCAGATCTTFVECSSSNPDCVCGTIAEGGGLCVPGSTQCATLIPCSNTGGCPSGSLCLIGSCCGVGVCVPTSLSAQCPSGSGGSNALRPPPSARRIGRTIGHR